MSSRAPSAKKRKRESEGPSNKRNEEGAEGGASALPAFGKSNKKLDMKIVYLIVAGVVLVVIGLLALIFKNKLTGKEEEVKTLQKSIQTKSLTYSEKLQSAEAERSRIEEELKTASSEAKEELEAQLSDLESQLSASKLEFEDAERNLAKLTTENAGLLDSLSEYLNSDVDSTPESEIILNVRTRAEKIAGELCDCFTQQGGWDVDAGVTLLSLDDILLHEPSEEIDPIPTMPSSPDPANMTTMTTMTRPAPLGFQRFPPAVPAHTVAPDPSVPAHTVVRRVGTVRGTAKKNQYDDIIINILKSTTWGQEFLVDYKKDLSELTMEGSGVLPLLEEKQKSFRKCFFNTLAIELDTFKKTEPSDYETGIFISELGASMLRTKCTRSILTNIKYGHTLQLLVDAAEKQVERSNWIDNQNDENHDLHCHVYKGGMGQQFTGSTTSYLTAHGEVRLLPPDEGEVNLVRNPILGGGTGFTICVWVKRSTVGSHWDRIIDFGEAYGRGSNIVVSFKDGITYQVYDAGTKKAELSTGSTHPFPQNEWVHVTIAQPRQGPTKIYWGTKTMVSKILPYFPADVARTRLFIGKSNWSNDPMFKGTMSDLFIWNSALNKPTITAVHSKHALPASLRPVISMFRTWCQDDDAPLSVTE